MICIPNQVITFVVYLESFMERFVVMSTTPYRWLMYLTYSKWFYCEIKYCIYQFARSARAAQHFHHQVSMKSCKEAACVAPIQ